MGIPFEVGAQRLVVVLDGFGVKVQAHGAMVPSSRRTRLEPDEDVGEFARPGVERRVAPSHLNEVGPDLLGPAA